jgi:hypothetical protein
MLSERSPDVKFEIGHVLFIDIVGYSKRLIGWYEKPARRHRLSADAVTCLRLRPSGIARFRPQSLSTLESARSAHSRVTFEPITRTRVRAYLRIHVTERQKTGVLQTTPRARVPVRFFHWPVTLTIAGARLH